MVAYANIFFAYLALAVLVTRRITAGTLLFLGLGAIGMVTYAKILFALFAFAVICTNSIATGASDAITRRRIKHQNAKNNCH